MVFIIELFKREEINISREDVIEMPMFLRRLDLYNEIEESNSMGHWLVGDPWDPINLRRGSHREREHQQ